MGQDATVRRQQHGAVLSHCLVGGNVLHQHLLRLRNQGLADVRQRLCFDLVELVLHPADRPEEIHRCRPGRAQSLADAVEVLIQFRVISGI